MYPRNYCASTLTFVVFDLKRIYHRFSSIPRSPYAITRHKKHVEDVLVSTPNFNLPSLLRNNLFCYTSCSNQNPAVINYTVK